MIGSKKNNKLLTEEMIFKTELISQWPDYLLMLSIPCMNVIFKDGLSEISVEDLVSYLKELNSLFGQEHNFMMKFSPNTVGNIIMMPCKLNSKSVKKTAMSTMALILTFLDHHVSPNKLLNGILSD